jgi:actin-like ATPase involved in cell morphogenesis
MVAVGVIVSETTSLVVVVGREMVTGLEAEPEVELGVVIEAIEDVGREMVVEVALELGVELELEIVGRLLVLCVDALVRVLDAIDVEVGTL